MTKHTKVYKYNEIIYCDAKGLKYPNTFALSGLLENEGKIMSGLDYDKSDYIAEYYYLVEDYESGFVDYQIEDWTGFLDKFAYKLGIEVLEV